VLPAAAARDAMLEGFALWANPSSPHKAGRAARAALEDARAEGEGGARLARGADLHQRGERGAWRCAHHALRVRR